MINPDSRNIDFFREILRGPESRIMQPSHKGLENARAMKNELTNWMTGLYAKVQMGELRKDEFFTREQWLKFIEDFQAKLQEYNANVTLDDATLKIIDEIAVALRSDQQ